LIRETDHLCCTVCGLRFQEEQGIPILIDDENSVFARADFLKGKGYKVGYALQSKGLRGLYRKTVVAIENAGNPYGNPDTAEIIRQVLREIPNGRVLIIGAGTVRYDLPNVVYSDVRVSPGIDCICDAQSLPFPDGYFAGVIAISVLEHIANPWICVKEIARVVCQDGHVYAVTPFLQPVHMGAYDFTRFTYLGHRLLFKDFDDIKSGCSMGPSKATAYLVPHLLANIVPYKAYKRIAHLLGLMLAWPVKQFDRVIGKREASYDAAAGVYFWGRKRPVPLTDKAVLAMYRGGMKSG